MEDNLSTSSSDIFAMFSDIKNQFLRFILNLALVLLLVFIFDRVAGSIAKHFYFKQVAGAFYRTTYAIDSTKADILVFGSSRANHHYVPEIFEDSLKMSFYNTGSEGNFLIYNYAVFKSIISRYKPKLIILDINPGELFYNKADYERLSSLLPYYDEHPEIHSIVEMRSPYERYKLFSSVYPYNSSLLTIAIGNLEYNKTRKGDRKGYLPLLNRMKEPEQLTLIKYDGVIDTVKLKALESIMFLCKKNNIKLVNVISPIYASTKFDITGKMVSELAKKFNAGFVDFSADTLFLNHFSWFQDVSHLNNEGASIFSSKLASELSKNYYVQ